MNAILTELKEIKKGVKSIKEYIDEIRNIYQKGDESRGHGL